MNTFFILLLVIVILLVIYVAAGFRVVPQNNEGLVETLGKYTRTVKAGFVFIWPFFSTNSPGFISLTAFRDF